MFVTVCKSFILAFGKSIVNLSLGCNKIRSTEIPQFTRISARLTVHRSHGNVWKKEQKKEAFRKNTVCVLYVQHVTQLTNKDLFIRVFIIRLDVIYQHRCVSVHNLHGQMK